MKKKRQEPRTGTETWCHPQKSHFSEVIKFPPKAFQILKTYNSRRQRIINHSEIRHELIWFPKLYWLKSKYDIEKQKMRFEYQSFTLSTPKSQISQKPLKKVLQSNSNSCHIDNNFKIANSEKKYDIKLRYVPRSLNYWRNSVQQIQPIFNSKH